MKKQKSSLIKFEKLNENENGILKSGFSVVINYYGGVNGEPTNIKCHETNNCNGGNCVKNCGTM